MTIQELYAQIGGNYEQAQRVMKMDKLIAYNVGYGASSPLRAVKAFEMYWHAEGMKTAFSGSVTVNGQTWQVRPESCFG